MLRRVLEALFLPPTSALIGFALGTALLRRWRRTGRALQVLALVWLWAAATPFVAGALLRSLQVFPALPAAGSLPAAEAIVVLSAESDPVGSEYGGATAGPLTMQRLRYAIALHRRTRLPLLVSGGVPGTGQPSLAAMMADAANAEFGVPVRWREERSADTRTNATESAVLLKSAGVHTILLVTSAWHMPRSVAAFEAEGLRVVAAPTGFRAPVTSVTLDLVPCWQGLRDTALALHEWVGRAVQAVAG
jgi:uncharacterized SAM-binding protein YcdF (DUF218 family)